MIKQSMILLLALILCFMVGCQDKEAMAELEEFRAQAEVETQNKEGEEAMTNWRDNPKLKGKFHPQYPDDIQVVIHDGYPRITKHRPELVWVRVSGCQGEVFLGTVLNQPEQLETVTLDSIIKFLMPEGGRYPLMVTDKYLSERDKWVIHPCNKCGLTELFNAPSDLTRVIFPDKPDDEITDMFTVFCGICGGVQVVENKEMLIKRILHSLRIH